MMSNHYEPRHRRHRLGPRQRRQGAHLQEPLLLRKGQRTAEMLLHDPLDAHKLLPALGEDIRCDFRLVCGYSRHERGNVLENRKKQTYHRATSSNARSRPLRAAWLCTFFTICTRKLLTGRSIQRSPSAVPFPAPGYRLRGKTVE